MTTGEWSRKRAEGLVAPLLTLLALRVDSALYLRYKIERKTKKQKQNGHELLCALERELCDANRAGRPRLKSVSFTSRLNLHTAEISQDATTESVSHPPQVFYDAQVQFSLPTVSYPPKPPPCFSSTRRDPPPNPLFMFKLLHRCWDVSTRSDIICGFAHVTELSSVFGRKKLA